ncbi:MAG TPA: hypothetical protein VNX46_04780, partial [Candidatus Acidoferrum sp.]|nr:hypothetical protein [Candidatus Acidoferrum sp.]
MPDRRGPNSMTVVLKVFEVFCLISLALFADHLEVYFLNGVTDVPIRCLAPRIQCMLFLLLGTYFAFILYLRGRFHCFWDITNSIPWLISFFTISTVRYFFDLSSTTDALNLLIAAFISQAIALCVVSVSKNDGAESLDNSINYAVFSLLLAMALGGMWLNHFGITYTYDGWPRWTGAWDNPNICGMLMGTGATLAIAMLVVAKNEEEIWSEENVKRKARIMFLSVLAVMMLVGLAMSYSRDACCGTTVGLLYFAKYFGKFKWSYVLSGIFVAAAVVWFFWNSTQNSDPW